MAQLPVIIRVKSPQIIGAVTRFSTDMADVPDSYDITLDQEGDGGTIVYHGTSLQRLTSSDTWKQTIRPALDLYFEWFILPNGGRTSPAEAQ